MRKLHVIQIQLSNAQLACLERLARREGCSPAALAAGIVAAGLVSLSRRAC